MNLFLGIDVGTGSARAGIFNTHGELLASHAVAIEIFRPENNFAEHSSNNIWQSICLATKAALKESNIKPEKIKGIGFDATCSLVAVNEKGQAVSVSPTGNDDQNVIVWMDHRAIKQAAEIDATGHDILKFTGGKISPEMQMPKLLWLKQNLPEQFSKTAYYFDLPDWLVFKATGADKRSICSATCKWTYQSSRGLMGEGWDKDFLSEIGLADLLKNDAVKIGNQFLMPGEATGNGLTKASADDLGLLAGTPVGASLIDAHAGALGTLGVKDPNANGAQKLNGRMALIAGTSACHINMTKEPCFVGGVWGPYFGIILDQFWCNEAGQSLAGALIDRILKGHGATADLEKEAADKGTSIYALLEEQLLDMAGSEEAIYSLTKDYHVQPDFHGNRSPLADPTRHGAITGLSSNCDKRDLALQYLATVQALAYGTKQIVEAINAKSGKDNALHTIIVSGGLAKNKLYLREHADVTGCTIFIPEVSEPVLLGSAILGAIAAKKYANVAEAMAMMSGAMSSIQPRGGLVANYHQAKYQVFEKMQQDFASYKEIMN